METETAAAKVLRESFARHPTLRLADRPSDTMTLPFQPTPTGAQVASTPDGRWTALVRQFKEGEARFCRLCPRGRCNAVGDSCLLLVPGTVRDDEALLFSTVRGRTD